MKRIISRLMPYRLKVQLHRAYNFVNNYVGLRTGRLNPLLPPCGLHCVGDGDYIEIGEEFFRYFVDIAGLKPQDRVLDVGCGTGRMAQPLTKYLKCGSYD